MDKEKYSIIFSSLTGNTKKLADTIRAVLPAEDCDYFGAPKAEELHSEILYIGFWTDKGNADSATLELLSKLRDKKVFLFGTAGFGGSEAYFQKILEHVKQSVGPSNSVFGEYMCQGKMPQSVRDRYMTYGLSTAPASAAPRSPYRHLELCGIALVLCRSKSSETTSQKWALTPWALHDHYSLL